MALFSGGFIKFGGEGLLSKFYGIHLITPSDFLMRMIFCRIVSLLTETLTYEFQPDSRKTRQVYRGRLTVKRYLQFGEATLNY